jgi:hypothetical protein
MGRWSFEAVANATDRARNVMFMSGTAPKFEDLVDWDFTGFNPYAHLKLLGIQRFVKGFFQKAGEAPPSKVERIYGYNIFCSSKAPEGVWQTMPSEDTPQRHGFYDVYNEGPGSKFPHSLMLHYGVPENHNANPERLIRDYLVQVNPNDPDLLLGKAFLQLGPVRVHSNFFILQRYRQHHYRP